MARINLCFRILFLQGFLIHHSYTKKEGLVLFNDILVSWKETKLVPIKERDFFG
jgi:hypothetical protein